MNAQETAAVATGQTSRSPSDPSPGQFDVPSGKLRNELRGDVDNIVLMALRKEPQRRYPSVEQLAADIQRHLAHLPVSATRATFRYRASKFVRRHKTGVFAAIAVAVALIAGVAATIHEARIARQQQVRAERRFNDVRKLANSLMFEIHDSIRDLPGSTAARKLLVDRALEYLDGLSSEGGGDPSFLRDLASAYERVGNVQGYFYSGNLGDTAGAMKSYQKALAIRESLAKSNPKDTADQSSLAMILFKVGVVLDSAGDRQGALEKNREVLAIRQTLADADPHSEEPRWDLASAHVALGDSLIDVMDRPAAERELREGIAEYEKLSADYPGSTRHRRMLSVTHGKLGTVLENSGDLAAANREYQAALPIIQDLVAKYPTNTLLQRNLAISYLNSGDIAVATGDFHGISYLREAGKIDDAIGNKDPSNRQIDRDISLAYSRIGDAEKKQGSVAQALRDYSHGLEAAKRRAASDPQNIDAAEAVANRYNSMGTLYAAMAADRKTPSAGRRQLWQQARSSFEKSLEFWGDPNRSQGSSAAAVVQDLRNSLNRCEVALNGEAPRSKSKSF